MTTPEDLATRRKLAARAAELLQTGFHCSEAVVLAVAPHVVRDWRPSCARMATGFAGGLGGTRSELCGALAGGVMVISALFGRSTLEDDTLAQRLTHQFHERFSETFDETQCQRLKEKMETEEGGATDCSEVVERTVMILLDLLAKAGVQLKQLPDTPKAETRVERSPEPRA